MTDSGPVRPLHATRLGLVVYLAGSILGAGIYALPFQVPRVGLLPMVAILLAVGAGVSQLYPRVIQAANRGSASASHSVSLGTPLRNGGGGRAGTGFGLLTALFLVLPGGTGYALVGTEAIRRLGNGFAELPDPAVAALVAALVLHGFGMRSEAAAFNLVVRALVGIAATAAFGLEGAAETVVLALGFAAGVGSLVKSSKAPGSNASFERSTFGLEESQARNATTSVIQAIVLLCIALGGLGVAIHAGGAQVPLLVVWPVSPSSLITATGLALFAFTSAGLFNVGGYASMRDERSMRVTVLLAISVVAAVQVLWTIAVNVSVESDALVALDAAGSDTAAGVAGVVAALGSQVGTLVSMFAAVLVLFGVSVGANAHAELLANEWFDSGRRLWSVEPKPVKTADRQRVRIATVVIVTELAVIAAVAQVSTTTVLGAAGLLGSSSLALALPVFCESRPRRTVVAGWLGVGIVSLAALASVTQLWLGDASPWLLAVGVALASSMVGVAVTVATRIPHAQRSPAAGASPQGPMVQPDRWDRPSAPARWDSAYEYH